MSDRFKLKERETAPECKHRLGEWFWIADKPNTKGNRCVDCLKYFEVDVGPRNRSVKQRDSV